MAYSNPKPASATSSTLPLVRLELLQPFVHELDRRALDADTLLETRGLSVRFPTDWLTHSIDREGLIAATHPPARRTHPPGSFLEALWLTLGTRLDSEDITVDHVAGLLGLSRQTLQCRLKAHDTSLTHEIAQLKQQRAIEALVHTDRPVADIGAALGFNNPANFTRAFRAWTGVPPRDYRRQHGGD